MKGNTKKNRLFSWFSLLVCLLFFLTGCVKYDVGIEFKDENHGKIVQHIKLGKQLTSFSQAEGNEWLASIESRSAKLHGKTKRISAEEIEVTIPFNNGKDMVYKFNQFFNPNPDDQVKGTNVDAMDLLQLNSQMSLIQNNWIFFERNRLKLDVDLRGLGVLSNQGNLIVSPGSIIDLELTLNTPWQAKNISGNNKISPEIRENGKVLVWKLIPGQINQIETVFWVPSILGIGTVVIILLMLIGFFVKYKHFPGIPQPANIVMDT